MSNPAERASPRNRLFPSAVMHGAADTRPEGALEHFWRGVARLAHRQVLEQGRGRTRPTPCDIPHKQHIKAQNSSETKDSLFDPLLFWLALCSNHLCIPLFSFRRALLLSLSLAPHLAQALAQQRTHRTRVGLPACLVLLECYS